jgi:integrase
VAQAAKGKREQDGWLERQNRALRDRGYRVSLDLHQGMVRLRATLPPKPSEPAASPWKQGRISTGLRYPDQASEAVTQAEKLGAAIERTHRTKESFDWSPWESSRTGGQRSAIGTSVGISGVEAIRQAELWWGQQRRRTASEPDTWQVDYAAPLRPLLSIPDLQPEHLIALAASKEVGSKTRLRTSRAAALVARALGLSADIQQQIRDLGKGYSPTTDTEPRNVPSDEELLSFIDALPTDWQWPVGICAVYGARPHEALLYAEVMDNKLLAISGGKTGARTSFALPPQWIERWDLTTKRLPVLDYQRSNKVVGSTMSRQFQALNAKFTPYDLRHAFAVRTIYSSKIGPSMAAKSMGHSLQVHNRIYHRWFDSSGMEALQVELLNAAA